MFDLRRDAFLADMDDVPGWLNRFDGMLMSVLSDSQGEIGLVGDLLEIGAYFGRSAILLGYLTTVGEGLHVCDTFSSDLKLPAENALWNSRYYPDLTRKAFEDNYLTHHDMLPTIHQLPSSDLPRAVGADSCRLVHVDGGHDHATVRSDAAVARHLLKRGGIAVFDDYCKSHLPGTALAVWEQVLSGDLVPVALSDAKLYGAWDSDAAETYRAVLVGWAAGRQDARVDEHRLVGVTVPRIVPRPPPTAWERSTSAGSQESTVKGSWAGDILEPP